AAACTLWHPDPMKNRGNPSWQGMGRLRSGTTIEQSRIDLNRIADGLGTLYPASNIGWGVDVETRRNAEVGEVRPVLMIMTASVAFVLLIACANVANLLLAR